VGDLYLAGAPFLGRFESFKGGHALNNQLLKALFAQPESFAMVDLFTTDNVVSLDTERHQPVSSVHNRPVTIAAE
jgi:UDP-3-O-[3-hydroxymyristoyl] N-acetylglucosamine deacetylase